MAMTETTRFTLADYERLPEGYPVELLEGELVKEPSPVPWHQLVVLEIADEARRATSRERVLVSPIDVVLDRWNVLQPDVLILRDGDRVWRGQRRLPLPALVVEVLSPATARRDRTRKTRRYLKAGIDEVWIVDPAKETVEVLTRSERRAAAGDEALSSNAVPGFSLVPAELFRE